MKKISVIMIALCAIIVVSCQSDTDKADKFRLNNEFVKAAELYKKAAAEGDAYAMWRLAHAYKNGEGVEHDKEKMLQYLKLAAEGGCEEAEYDLATLYLFGTYGINKDAKKGKAMIDAIVNQTDNSYVLTQFASLLFYGTEPYDEDKDKAFVILDNIKDKNESTYLLLACVYENGTATMSPNINKAVKYYKKAFDNGFKYSAYLLYLDYMLGYGGLKADTTIALEWLQKGVEANNNECMVEMSDYCLSEDSKYSLYHNVSRGLSLLETAAKHGSSNANRILGGYYYGGEHVRKDDIKAFEYTTKSAEMGDSTGTYNLGWFYINGVGCDKDITKGIEIWEEAVRLGSGDAATNLYIYYSGYNNSNGVPQGPINKQLAKEYLLTAAKMGERYAFFNLARHYLNGSEMFEKNNQMAFIYTQKAADAGVVDAYGVLAYLYKEGIGCDKDLDKAREYENMTKAKEDLEKEKQIEK